MVLHWAKLVELFLGRKEKYDSWRKQERDTAAAAATAAFKFDLEMRAAAAANELPSSEIIKLSTRWAARDKNSPKNQVKSTNEDVFLNEKVFNNESRSKKSLPGLSK